MSPSVQDTPVFIDTRHIDVQLLLQDVYLFIDAKRCIVRLSVQIVTHFFKDPRLSKGCSTNHNGIYAKTLKSLFGFLGRGYVAISNDRNVDARIVFYLTNQRPISVSGVHLTARAAMDGQRLDATVLQLLGQFGDNKIVFIPSQACLHSHRCMHCLDHLSGNFQQKRYVTQHASTRTFACHLLNRTSKVDVNHVRMSLFNNLGSFHHRLNVSSVDLYAYGSFSVTNG